MHPRLALILMCVIALLSGTYLQLFGFALPGEGKRQPDPAIEGFFWPHQKQLEAFEMLDQDRNSFTLDSLTGKWNFLFFGYTHCPDICPITMNTMREVNQTLAKNQTLENNPGFVFVSVDGERDSPEHLKQYVSFFGDYFSGATGDKNQVDSLTSQLGIPYAVDEHQPGSTDYLVSHSGAIFLISPEATLAAIYQPPHDPADIADRLSRIVQFLN